MTEIRKVRTDSANYDLAFPEKASSIYADGVAVAALGVPISRIVFYTVSTPSDEQSATETESRKVCLELSMPMGSMLELAKRILDAAKSNQTDIATAFDKYKEGLIEQINS